MGVLDVMYSDPNAAMKKKTKEALEKLGIHTPQTTLTTTGEVAEKLEKEYEVMGVFFEIHGKEVADIMSEAYTERAEDILNGRPISAETFHEAMRRIEDMFREYLDRDEWQQHTGIQIARAKSGVSFRHGRKKLTKKEIEQGLTLLEADLASIFNLSGKRGARPAFIDTGLYQESVRAWWEESKSTEG